MNGADFTPIIDYIKTIEQEKLVYKRAGWDLFWCILGRILIVAVMFINLVVAFREITNSNNNAPIVIVSLIDICIIVNLLFSNRLIKVEGLSLLRNKEDVMNTLRKFYDDVTFDASKENIIRDVKFSRFNAGRVLTVVLKGDTIYFHRATLGRGNLIIPFLGFYNYYRCKEFAEYFQKMQEEQSVVG